MIKNIFRLEVFLLSLAIAVGVWYFLGHIILIICSWTFPFNPDISSKLFILISTFYVVAALYPSKSDSSMMKKKPKAVFSCICVEPEPIHFAGHIAMRHYLKKNHEDIDVSFRVALLAMSGETAEVLINGVEFNHDSEDMLWLSSYLKSNDIGMLSGEILMEAKSILEDYPLSKMAENISNEGRSRSGSPSLMQAAGNTGKIGGAYDDVNLMPFMDR